MHIFNSNGLLSLNIPIKHNKGRSVYQVMDRVRIENKFNWQIKHWRSLEASYRSTPYFEYYEEILYPLYHHKFYEFLIDFNLDCFKIICSILELDLEIGKTENYKTEYGEGWVDSRDLVQSKNTIAKLYQPYYQVFSDKGLGFLGNLSILDLVLHEGSSASRDYLKTLN